MMEAYLLSILSFAKVEGQVLVFDHVLDLSAHGQGEEYDEIDKQNWPEHRDVEDGKEAHDERCHCGTNCIVPEFEFRQSTDERAELVLSFGGVFILNALFDQFAA